VVSPGGRAGPAFAVVEVAVGVRVAAGEGAVHAVDTAITVAAAKRAASVRRVVIVLGDPLGVLGAGGVKRGQREMAARTRDWSAPPSGCGRCQPLTTGRRLAVFGVETGAVEPPTPGVSVSVPMVSPVTVMVTVCETPESEPTTVMTRVPDSTKPVM